MGSYEERHVMRYDPTKEKEVLEALSKAGLAEYVYFHSGSSMVLRIPEAMRETVRSLESKFGDTITLVPEPLTPLRPSHQ